MLPVVVCPIVDTQNGAYSWRFFGVWVHDEKLIYLMKQMEEGLLFLTVLFEDVPFIVSQQILDECAVG